MLTATHNAEARCRESFGDPRFAARRTLCCAGGVMCLIAGCSGIDAFRQNPARIATAPATPMAVAAPTVPPVEPQTKVVEPAPQERVDLVDNFPAPPSRSTPNLDDQNLAALREQLAAVQKSLEGMERQQAEVLQALAAMKSSEERRDLRLVAVETQIATQSAVLADLRRAMNDSQREQWRTLDVLSDGLDKILENEPVVTAPNVAESGPGQNRSRHARFQQASSPHQESLR